jgi:uroporphyrinogen decarboxylase
MVSVFEIMRNAIGDVVMLESMCSNPNWIRDFCDVVTDNQIVHLDRFIAEMGRPDGIWIYEDLGYTQSPFISPAMYRDLIMPVHKRLCGFIHDQGLPVIMHSCGRIAPLFPQMVEAGIDCLQVMEAKAGQHVVKMAESVSRRIAYMGNLDIRAFESNDPKQLDAEVIPKLTALREKKIPFIFHSDHSIPQSVKLKTYEYALELFRKYGRY